MSMVNIVIDVLHTYMCMNADHFQSIRLRISIDFQSISFQLFNYVNLHKAEVCVFFKLCLYSYIRKGGTIQAYHVYL